MTWLANEDKFIMPGADKFIMPECEICVTCKKEVDIHNEAEHIRFYGHTSYWPGHTECGDCLDIRHGYKGNSP